MAKVQALITVNAEATQLMLPRPRAIPKAQSRCLSDYTSPKNR
jgi:hypothetical protein